MKRKSNDIHQLHGSYRADRHATPKLVYPPATVTAAPKFLDKIARKEWQRVATLLSDAGLLTEADLGTLAAYCAAYGGWRECSALIAEQGQIVQVESSTRTGRTMKPIRNPAVTLMLDYQRAMLAAAAKFGFSPLDRERIDGTSETKQEAAHCAAPDEDDFDHSDLYAR